MTLGSAPSSTGTQLGSTVAATVAWIGDGNIGTGVPTFLTTSSFTFSQIGTWLMSILTIGYVSAPVSGVVILQSSSGNYLTAPYATTSFGSAPNIQCFAAGSNIIKITGATTFNIVISLASIPTGVFFSRNSDTANVTFTRIA